MGSRSRKRKRKPAPAGAGPKRPAAAPRPAAPLPAPAGSSPSRARAPGPLDDFSAEAAPPKARRQPTEGQRPKRLRGEAANEAVRSRLEPLDDRERPVALLIAVAVTLLLGLGNLVSFLLGFKVTGKVPPAGGVIGFAGVMFVMAWGMWTKRYWAILGFQALLALIVIIFALLLLTASNLAAVGVCIGVAGLGGWLFWKLVRVLSRVQMPERPGR